MGGHMSAWAVGATRQQARATTRQIKTVAEHPRPDSSPSKSMAAQRFTSGMPFTPYSSTSGAHLVFSTFSACRAGARNG